MDQKHVLIGVAALSCVVLVISGAMSNYGKNYAGDRWEGVARKLKEGSPWHWASLVSAVVFSCTVVAMRIYSLA